MSMMAIPQVRDGAGRHAGYIPSRDVMMSGLHFNFATQPICVIALGLAKVTITPAEGAINSNEEVAVAGVGMVRPYSDSIVPETLRDIKTPRTDVSAVVDRTRRNSIGAIV
ncbi:hypothetical protein PspLS_06103 [Pyricularia sp. CBS 133598]|nr:hypothetical protein PspLS_06103 [Pyricularia sp. CBS 133598]